MVFVLVVARKYGSASSLIPLANPREPDDKEREMSENEGATGKARATRRIPMSLKPQAISPVPAETIRVARAAYPKGNVYMQMRDVLGSIYTDEDFADLFPKDGQPAQAPWRLALVTVLQFVENLSDRASS